jgi:hypothetical protein
MSRDGALQDGTPDGAAPSSPACPHATPEADDRRAAKGSLTPEQRSLRARTGAYALHARHDPRATTKAGRDVFLGRFEQQVDPDRTLSAEERAKRALAARRAYFSKLALASSRARRARASRRRER